MTRPTVCCLCGGFGAAKFAPALVESVGARDVVLVTNPGDDFRFTALEVLLDFDSALYAVDADFDEELGWGRRGDATVYFDALGAEGWFRNGGRRHRAQPAPRGVARGRARSRGDRRAGGGPRRSP